MKDKLINAIKENRLYSQPFLKVSVEKEGIYVEENYPVYIDMNNVIRFDKVPKGYTKHRSGDNLTDLEKETLFNQLEKINGM